MRQASWNEMFAPKRGAPSIAADVPREPSGWRRFFWWEDAVTFVLLGVVVLAVIDSVYRSHWVDTMPSLYPVSFFGLLLAAVLARLRWPEVVIHLIALPAGAAASLATILSIVPGSTPWDRYDALHARMAAWFDIAFNGGISNDDLPFIVLVVPLAFLAAYISSWAVFRWRNIWFALIPSGLLLLSNVSYFSGQFSFSVLIFIVAGILLVTRLHLMSQAKTWRESDTPYPAYMSLSVMHITFWTAFVLLGAAWIMPAAGQSPALNGVWKDATAPVTHRVAKLSRLFVSVRGNGSLIHSYDDLLAFQGAIELSDIETLQVELGSSDLELPAFLRAQSFGVYSPAGWEQGASQEGDLPADTDTLVDQLPGSVSAGDEQLKGRIPVPVTIESLGKTGDTAFSVGQLRQINRGSTVRWTMSPSDITGAQIPEGLSDGSTYDTVGSVSVATEEELRGACTYIAPAALANVFQQEDGVITFNAPGTGPGGACNSAYPGATRFTYTSLPYALPDRVGNLARDLTAKNTNTYDAAVSVEKYLRSFPVDYDIPNTPQGRDTIDYFLFDLQRGYFDYHASAMVVLLRSIGIPSRLAVGYVLDPSDRIPGTNRFRVTEQNAYAWPEVYFPGYGWVEFNPTPDEPRIHRQSAAVATGPAEPGAAPSTALGLEDLPAQLGMEPDAGSPFTFEQPASGNHDFWILIGVLGGLATLAVLAVAGGSFLWLRGLAGVSVAERRWEQLSRLASWSGTPPDPTQTPHEFASTLRERVPAADGVDLLADAYVEQQFGERPVPDSPRLAQAWQNVRTGLLKRLFRLK